MQPQLRSLLKPVRSRELWCHLFPNSHPWDAVIIDDDGVKQGFCQEVDKSRADLGRTRESRAYRAQRTHLRGACHQGQGIQLHGAISTKFLNARGRQFLRSGKFLVANHAALCIPVSVLPDWLSESSHRKSVADLALQNARGARDARGVDRVQKARASISAAQAIV